MRVLVTGGKGFIGSQIDAELTAGGHAVESVDLCWFNSVPIPGAPNIKVDYSRLTNSAIQNYDAIVVAGAHSSVAMSEGHGVEVFENTVTNVMRLLRRMRRDQQLICFSSGSVYGWRSQEPQSEVTPLDRVVTTYDASKRALELALQAQDWIQRWTVFRCATVCGTAPHTRVDTMINEMYQAAKTHGTITLKSPAVNRSFISVKDVARATRHLLERNMSPGILNLLGFNASSSLVARRVAEHCDCNVVVQEAPAAAYNFSMSGTLLAATGWEPRDCLADILADLDANFATTYKSTRRTPVTYLR